MGMGMGMGALTCVQGYIRRPSPGGGGLGVYVPYIGGHVLEAPEPADPIRRPCSQLVILLIVIGDGVAKHGLVIGVPGAHEHLPVMPAQLQVLYPVTVFPMPITTHKYTGQ